MTTFIEKMTFLEQHIYELEKFCNLHYENFRSFTIQKKNREAKDEKFGNIVQAKQEMSMTKEQQEEAKRVRNFLLEEFLWAERYSDFEGNTERI